MRPANRWLLLIVLLVLMALAIYALKFRALFAPPLRSSINPALLISCFTEALVKLPGPLNAVRFGLP